MCMFFVYSCINMQTVRSILNGKMVTQRHKNWFCQFKKHIHIITSISKFLKLVHSMNLDHLYLCFSVSFSPFLRLSVNICMYICMRLEFCLAYRKKIETHLPLLQSACITQITTAQQFRPFVCCCRRTLEHIDACCCVKLIFISFSYGVKCTN